MRRAAAFSGVGLPSLVLRAMTDATPQQPPNPGPWANPRAKAESGSSGAAEEQRTQQAKKTYTRPKLRFVNALNLSSFPQPTPGTAVLV